MDRYKLRIRFAKQGDLRLVSHRDLMRTLERALRRAELPFSTTEGFNPKPRMSFPLPLGLGIEGRDELLELELREPVPPDEVRRRLAEHAPPGFAVRSVEPLALGDRARVDAVRYEVPIPPERRSAAHEAVRSLLGEG